MWYDNALSIYTLDGGLYSYKHYEQIIHRIDFVKPFEVHGIILETFLFIKRDPYIPVNILKAFRLILISASDTYQILLYHNISYTPCNIVEEDSSKLINTYIGKPVLI